MVVLVAVSGCFVSQEDEWSGFFDQDANAYFVGEEPSPENVELWRLASNSAEEMWGECPFDIQVWFVGAPGVPIMTNGVETPWEERERLRLLSYDHYVLVCLSEERDVYSEFYVAYAMARIYWGFGASDPEDFNSEVWERQKELYDRMISGI